MEPIKPLPYSLYRCDSRFHTEVLKEQLENDLRYGFAVVDGNGFLLAIVQGNTQQELYRYSASLPKKHRNGGQSAPRFARMRLEARHNYLTKVAEHVNHYFIDKDTHKPNIQGMVLAGSADLKDQLSECKMLDPRIQSIIVATVDVAYGFTQGLAQAIELAAPSLKQVTLIQQKQLMSKFFEEIATDSGKICFGARDTMASLEGGAVDKLLIWEELDVVRYTLSNAAGEMKVVYCKPGQVFSDKSNQGWEILNSEPLVDWLAEHYQEFGAQLVLVSDTTPEGSQFCRGFGGIGSLLRYRMDFEDFEEKEDHEEAEEEDEEDFWGEGSKTQTKNEGKEEEDDDLF